MIMIMIIIIIISIMDIFFGFVWGGGGKRLEAVTTTLYAFSSATTRASPAASRIN